LLLLCAYVYAIISPSLFDPFCFNATAPTYIYTLSLHDALPISFVSKLLVSDSSMKNPNDGRRMNIQAPSTKLQRSSNSQAPIGVDRKSTRLNSSHGSISYAVFCLKKKRTKQHLLEQRISKHRQQ